MAAYIRILRLSRIAVICLMLLLIQFSGILPAAADAPPNFPSFGPIYYGSVTIAGSPAGAGASIVAKVNGAQMGSAITDASGKYSMMIPDTVGVTVPSGATITFFVNGVQATPTAAYGQGSLNVNINAPTAGTAPASLSISTTSLPSGTVGTAYSATLSASGGTSPYSWNTASGSLPAGLSLSSTGAITGTPTTAGTYSFTLQVSDGAGHSASAAYTVTVNPAAATAPLSISTTTLPSGTVGTAYSAQVAPAGGKQPYTWSLFSGTLPAGLNLNSDGVISGTPSAATTTSFTVRVVDGASNYSTKTLTLTIGQAPSTNPPAATPSTPATPAPTAPASSSPSASTPSSSTSSGGSSTSPVSAATFSISDIRATTTPTQSGTRVNITVRVANSGSTQGSKTLVLKINDEGVAQEDVVLAPGESKEVTFSVTKNTPGTYRAGIDFLSTSFEIPPASSTGTTSSGQYPLSPTIVGVIFAAGLLAILVLLVLIIRKYRS